MQHSTFFILFYCNTAKKQHHTGTYGAVNSSVNLPKHSVLFLPAGLPRHSFCLYERVLKL